MSFTQSVRDTARDIVAGKDPREAVTGAVQKTVEGFGLDPGDFIAAREQGASTGTRIEARSTALHNAGEALNRSHFDSGPGGPVHVITPMVMPKGTTLRSMLPVTLFVVIGMVGTLFTLPFDDLTVALFGPHYWLLVLLFAAFMWWRRGMVMVPEGCIALITRFGKVEAEAGPGRVTLLNPWKRVSYIVNVTREYPFNAPIHEAPTKSRVKASVDLFLQFRIVNPREFIFVLGAVQGFQDKLNNAISETTRSLIYEQEASSIYDLVGESTQGLLDQLNAQFQPAVEFSNANITHAEPSSQEYRMDLAAPEMVRVAKEAYTYEYELQLRKEQNEGDLNKDLASLNETLSSIQAEIAQYQAQMDTALERETNRARALARQRFVEAESTANANAALLEAQALDIRALSAAEAPEILDYRYQQDMLSKLESLAGSLPQIVQVGGDSSDGVDFLRIAQQIVGGASSQLFTDEELAQIRTRQAQISERVDARQSEIAELLQADERIVATVPPEPDEELPGADRVEEIRRSVSADSLELPPRGAATAVPQHSSDEAPTAATEESRTHPGGRRRSAGPWDSSGGTPTATTEESRTNPGGGQAPPWEAAPDSEDAPTTYPTTPDAGTAGGGEQR